MVDETSPAPAKVQMSRQSPGVAIIGAGPAGLMAAQVLASKGITVAVFDGKPTPARKLLMAGRGGLNLTHHESLEKFITRYGKSAHHLEPVIRAFPPNALINWAEDLGQETFTGTSGRVFPKSLKASPLLRAWMARLNTLGVTFHFRHDWLGWELKNETLKSKAKAQNPALQNLVFKNRDKKRIKVKANAVILALGGASWPKLGADGRWVAILQKRNIKLTPLSAFNAGVKIPWSQTILDNFTGQPLKRITVTLGGNTGTGEAVITKTGLEGGAIYILNEPIKKALEQGSVSTLTLDLRPDLTRETLKTRLEKPRNNQSTSTFLRKAVRLSKPAIALLREPSGGKLPEEADKLAQRIKSLPLTITGLCAIERAISTSGGIKESEIDQTGMLKTLPGVFAAGEMRDWDAPTGGYLLQATFATAVQAANGTLTWLNKNKNPAKVGM